MQGGLPHWPHAEPRTNAHLFVRPIRIGRWQVNFAMWRAVLMWRVRALRLAAIAIWTVCACSRPLYPKQCPRPDADCFYAAFAARMNPQTNEVTPEAADDKILLPLSSHIPSDAAVASGGGGGDGTDVDSPGPTAWSWESYHSHEAMLDFLQKLVSASGGVCTLDGLSPSSVEGRQIVAVVVDISKDATDAVSRMPKPSFTWIGNMHGDETANRELLLRLAWGMCSGELVAADGRWRALQESTVVRIAPTINPDGFAHRRRLNLRNVDLNRNFWTHAFPYAPPLADLALAQDVQGAFKYPTAASWVLVGGNTSLEPEAQAISSYLLNTFPDLSANLHGGALVANYPLDACDSLGSQRHCPTADASVPGLLAAAYAGSHPSMALNSAAPFVNGTVEGASWYPVLGSLQDWVYHVLKRLHITLELHPVKDPPASSLPSLWETNRRSMLRLMELARMGLRARVVDAVTHGSLAANVSVSRPTGVRGTTADAARGGYFFKSMAPGVEYEFHVKPYDPTNVGLSYDVITFRAALPLGYREYLSGRGSLRDLTVEKVLSAFRSNVAAAVKK